MMNAVDGVYALQHVFQRVHRRVLAKFDGQTFVSHVLKRNHLGLYLFLRQFLSSYILVLCVVRTVYTSVHAVVRQIQWSEQYDSVSVQFVLDFPCQLESLLVYLSIRTFQQSQRLSVRNALLVPGLCEYFLKQCLVVLVLLGKSHSLEYFLMIDEFSGNSRTHIVFHIVVF